MTARIIPIDRGKSGPSPDTSSLRKDVGSILILAAEEDRVSDLASGLAQFGYDVCVVDSWTDFTHARRDTSPYAGIIYDMPAAFDGALSRAQLPNLENAPPLLLISDRDDFATRLEAVRGGIQGFFTRDVEPLTLLDKIEQIANLASPPSGYRVLLVDDDEDATEACADGLSLYGMQVTTLNDPARILDLMNEQSFDLAVFDFRMPACNGYELAAIVRQNERYVGLPIIFVTGEQDIKIVVESHPALGIDDFLTKPFQLSALVTMIQRRATRAAELRAHMMRDSLTGLLNHANFMDRLKKEVSRMSREGGDATYALLDIDHFKSVNDLYGHATGDQVIKGLARALMRRLRTTDVIGRCGGEEFGVLMPSCRIADAYAALDAIRKSFSETPYFSEGRKIRTSFSAGLTAIDSLSNFDSIISTADKALYEAKNLGRNRMCIGNSRDAPS